MGSTDTLERTVYTARFPVGLYRWMRNEIEGSDSSLNDFIVQMATDLRDCYGMPAVMAAALEADRKALGLGRRQYVMHLLTRRYEKLIATQPGFNASRPATTRSDSKPRKARR